MTANLYRGLSKQEGINSFKYFYNEAGELKNVDKPTEGFKFTNQKEYEALGDAITEFIQKQALETHLKMTRKNGISEKDYFYISNDFFTNDKGCLLMIQGSGAVRPGIWARQVCINEGLDTGAMVNFVEKANNLGLSSIIMNPNVGGKRHARLILQSYFGEQKFISKKRNYMDEQENVDMEQVEGIQMPNKKEELEGVAKKDGSAAEVNTKEVKIDDKKEEIKNDTKNEDIKNESKQENPKEENKEESKKEVIVEEKMHTDLKMEDNKVEQKLCPAKKIYIIAHSAGGWMCSQICKKYGIYLYSQF
jgi:hypothetical protein